jgi:hypothetical protein
VGGKPSHEPGFPWGGDFRLGQADGAPQGWSCDLANWGDRDLSVGEVDY